MQPVKGKMAESEKLVESNIEEYECERRVSVGRGEGVEFLNWRKSNQILKNLGELDKQGSYLSCFQGLSVNFLMILTRPQLIMVCTEMLTFLMKQWTKY